MMGNQACHAIQFHIRSYGDGIILGIITSATGLRFFSPQRYERTLVYPIISRGNMVSYPQRTRNTLIYILFMSTESRIPG
jgi:hypothetical protein